jgi:hypothetical protein
MSDRSEIIDVVNAVFGAVDAKEWDAAQVFFEASVKVDYTSLKGGEPETISSAELVNGWRKGLHDGKDKTFHLFGSHRVTADEDTAAAVFKGYSFTLHAPEFGGHLWEVWGDYEMLLRRTPTGWRVNAISVFASVTRSGPKAVQAWLGHYGQPHR